MAFASGSSFHPQLLAQLKESPGLPKKGSAAASQSHCARIEKDLTPFRKEEDPCSRMTGSAVVFLIISKNQRNPGRGGKEAYTTQPEWGQC
jgi:hypothetical protein